MFSLLTQPNRLDLLYTIRNLKPPTSLFLTTLPHLLDFLIGPTSYLFKCPLRDSVSQENSAYVGLTTTTLPRQLTMHLNNSSSLSLCLSVSIYILPYRRRGDFCSEWSNRVAISVYLQGSSHMNWVLGNR